VTDGSLINNASNEPMALMLWLKMSDVMMIMKQCAIAAAFQQSC
jgi:hypothetical protein